MTAAWVRFCVRAGVALFAAAALSGLSATASDEVIDRVLAVVGGDVITLSDVRTARELGRVDTAGAADPVRAALTQLIDRALVVAEVNRFAPPEPAVAAVDAAYTTLVARLGGQQPFDAALHRLGVDVPLVRELLREDLRIAAYIDQRFVADSPSAQRAVVDSWVAGLRRRAEIVDLYASPTGAIAPGSGTAAPARH